MYLAQADIEKGIYPEILNVLTRNEGNIDTAIAEAIEEVKAYLTARYNVDEEFAKTGNARNKLVVKLVREVALYNCYKISNPVNMPESRVQIYKDTIAFLKDVQAERATIKELSRLTDATNGGSSFIKFGGNTKRNNSY